MHVVRIIYRGDEDTQREARRCSSYEIAALYEEGHNMADVLLETSRLVLRRFVIEDWADLQVLAMDWAEAPGPAFDKWPAGEEDVKGLAGHFAERPKFLAVCRKVDHSVVGLIGLNGIEAKTGMFDLGHVILSDCQDGDLDREALLVAVDHIFGAEDVTTIITHNEPTHEEQLRPLLSIGFMPKEGGERGTLMLDRIRWEKQGV